MPTINSRFYIKSSESVIFKKSYEALSTIIQRIYGKKIPVVGTLDENDINRELGRTTLDLSKYPYAMIVPTNLTDNLESYNTFDLKKYGTEPIKHSDGYYYTFHLKPVRLTCSVTFFSQNFNDILNYMSNWNFNAREGTFKLRTKEGMSFDIHVSIEPDINFPTKDYSEGSPLKVVSTIILDTYVGEVYKSPELKCIKNNIRLVLAPDFEDLEPSLLLGPEEDNPLKVTSYGEPRIEPDPEPIPQPIVTDFDYMVLRYMWEIGSDLDTETAIVNADNIPSINNLYVGWKSSNSLEQGPSVPRYDLDINESVLYWPGDERHSGQEGILLNYKKLISDEYKSLLPKIIQIKLSATWYTSAGSTLPHIRIEAYKGGEMIKSNDTTFINVGGKLIKIRDSSGVEKDYIDVDITKEISYRPDYTHVATLYLNKETGAASISTNVDDI